MDPATADADDPFARYPHIRAMVERQGIITLMGARIAALDDGYCRVELPYGPHVGQHNGFFHGGAIGAISDLAGGFSAGTYAGPDQAMLTVEYKINFIAPAKGVMLLAEGRVLRRGRTLMTSEIHISARDADGMDKLCAAALQTTMAVEYRPEK